MNHQNSHHWRQKVTLAGHCLLAIALCSDARILTIEEFGGLPDSQLPTKKEPIVHHEFLHSSLKASPLAQQKQKYHPHRHQRSAASDMDIEQAIKNTHAYNTALLAANPGDTVLLKEHESYTFLGGIEGSGLHDITLDFAGYTRFMYDADKWPMRGWSGGSQWEGTMEYVPAIDLVDCANVILTCSAQERAVVDVDYDTDEIHLDPESGNGGILDGHGKKWWDDAIYGNIEVESRPRLMDIRSSLNITVEYLTLVNSPYWTLTIEAVGAEVHHVNILIDRNYQRHLVNNTVWEDVAVARKRHRQLRARTEGGSRDVGVASDLHFHFPTLPDWLLQPQNLNTDGIDPIGENIYIHDCIILNDDDSIAVKPPRNGGKGSVLNDTVPYECTRNITIENMVLTGFGASIGSVGPNENHPCVDQVTFKNIQMPGTGKGIYIKSNKSACRGNDKSSITNILYDNIHIKDSIWWPIWIGPQQQHEPHQSLGGACALEYPLHGSLCPTQGCSTFENITLRNVVIDNPLLSPGVIMGNATNPMKNILFENVTMTVPFKYYLTHGRLPFHEKRFPYAGTYECENVASGTCKGCNPVPPCFETVNE